MKTSKRICLWIIGVVLFLASVSLVGYPFISSYLNEKNTDSSVVSYINSLSSVDSKKQELMLKEAKEYNAALVGKVTINDPFSGDVNVSEKYNSLLRINDTDVMATIEIPSIGLNLPVFHGTGEDALLNGAGHLPSSSLPVGGKGSHCVLTGHTGISNKKLFSDVASIKTGDVFFINVLNKKLCYQVDEINTVLPQNTEKLQIVPDKDYVTLVTCTPFGVNTHRLLVRGTRISYNEGQKLLSDKKNSSTWSSEYIKAIVIGVSVMLSILLVFAIILFISRRLREKNENKGS